MRTKSFQLEQTVPGAFFFQGFAAGMLAGFMASLAVALLSERPGRNWLIPLTPFYMIILSVPGVLIAALLWGTYRLTKVHLRVAARVAITTVCIGLLTYWIATKTENLTSTDYVMGVSVAVLAALPTALLVGSRVKPWEFFTFGSIANGAVGRSGSRSVLATFGTLPLRLVSLLALGYWILLHACMRDRDIDPFNINAVDIDAVDVAVVFGIPAVYLLYTTYVSFRSPRKIVLLVSGLAINVPVAFIAFYTDTFNADGRWWGEAFLTIRDWSTTFLIAWGLFLAARLSVRAKTVVELNPLPALQRDSRNSNHHCLGSRFLEWRTIKARS